MLEQIIEFHITLDRTDLPGDLVFRIVAQESIVTLKVDDNRVNKTGVDLFKDIVEVILLTRLITINVDAPYQ